MITIGQTFIGFIVVPRRRQIPIKRAPTGARRPGPRKKNEPAR